MPIQNTSECLPLSRESHGSMRNYAEITMNLPKHVYLILISRAFFWTAATEARRVAVTRLCFCLSLLCFISWQPSLLFLKGSYHEESTLAPLNHRNQGPILTLPMVEEFGQFTAHATLILQHSLVTHMQNEPPYSSKCTWCIVFVHIYLLRNNPAIWVMESLFDSFLMWSRLTSVD